MNTSLDALTAGIGGAAVCAINATLAAAALAEQIDRALSHAGLITPDAAAVRTALHVLAKHLAVLRRDADVIASVLTSDPETAR